jgi:hypothetical protein
MLFCVPAARRPLLQYIDARTQDAPIEQAGMRKCLGAPIKILAALDPRRLFRRASFGAPQ